MSEEKTILTAGEADRLLGAGDGTAALLLLHIRRSGGCYTPSGAARELHCSETEIVLAAKKLRQLGLLEPLPEHPAEEQELPSYTAEDILRRAREDKTFAGLRQEAEQTLGRGLNSNDLRLLLGLYDHLGLPAEVIVMLLHHCVETYQERNGAGRLPTMRYVEKEGWFWAGQEILTLEAAEEHIAGEKRKQETAERVKNVLQIRGRELTASEHRYVEDWIAKGYGPETLAIAYDKTVIATGRLTWKYMDRIVQSWNEKRLYTPAEIEAGDTRTAQPRRRNGEPERSESEKMEQLRKLANHLNKKEG